MSEINNSEGSVSRREFLGGTALTAAGAAVGISVYFRDWRKLGPDLPSLSAREEDRVRLGFIGVGNRGGALLRTSLQVPGALPVAVADVQKEKRDSCAKDIRAQMETKIGDPDFKVETYDDYRRVLDDKEVEGVVIATPHYLHGPMAIDAIEAGKHVYCEKALAFTIGENQDIYRLVKVEKRKTPQGYDLVFQVGHQRHYSPLYQRVKDMVESDHIGDIAAIRAQWNLNDEISRPLADPELEKVVNWRLYSDLSGGLTTEYATHQIDVANWLLGTHPDSVCGFGGVDFYTEDNRDTHDNINLIFDYTVPIPKRDSYGRVVKEKGETVYLLHEEGPLKGRRKTRKVRFMYMSNMANAHLTASEMVLGRYGTIEVALAGGEFFKEKKARQDPRRIAEGTNPARAHQKSIVASGATVDPSTASLTRKQGDPISGEVEDRYHWTRYIEPIKGQYDQVETLLAME
ncbi:MAG: Gfo/Idh/MocA family oxidoreductase, partial [Planctomycetes bacterium]|nr:Gfo/Idh/MocA family oxidoreductase [Planctomycetota bacterium]